MNQNKKTIEIIVPCFNEEDCVEIFYKEIKKIFSEQLKHYNFLVMYIDDGSKDGTIEEIHKVANQDPEHVKYVSFSRNFGKEAALYVGFEKSSGDYVVPMDADLQHPPFLLIEMAKALEEGYDCAAACRVNREGESIFRKVSSNLFYRFISNISGIELRQGSTDYRMMKRNVVEAIVSFGERERFTKGVYSWVGFKTKWIEYKNVERIAGSTKWNFRGLLNYGINGFVAFTTTPLRAASWMGMMIVLIDVIYGIYTVTHVLLHPELSTGRATIILIMLALCGVIIIILGIIGEYLARIYSEVKRRPIYIIRDTNISDSNIDVSKETDIEFEKYERYLYKYLKEKYSENDEDI